MKKIYLLLVLSLAFVACDKKQDNFLIVKGNIENFNENEILLKLNNEVIKTISVTNNAFTDTIYLKSNDSLSTYRESFYVLQAGARQTLTYLKNGFDLNINIDLNDFENIEYTGKGAENSNYLKEKMQVAKEYINPYDLLNAEQDEFDESLADIEIKLNGLFEKYANLDKVLAEGEKASDEEFIKIIAEEYSKKASTSSTIKKGEASPAFTNYESIDGKKYSLSDLKGKYVYIDIWATWCGPCKMEIPFLKKLETKYHDKDISFVSISVDQNKEAWAKMVEEKALSGIQLHFGKDNSFMDAYQVTGIPRFILLDKEGKIIDENAPRPSSQEITKIFDALNI